MIKNRKRNNKKRTKKIYIKIKKIISKLYNKFKYKKTFISIIFSLIFITLILFIFIENYILSEDKIIKDISFYEEDIKNYSNGEFYSDFIDKLQGKNLYKVKHIEKDEIISQINKKYNILEEFDIHKYKDNFRVKFQFTRPKIVFNNGEKTFGTVSENFFEITTGSNLSSGYTQIKLPKYTTGYNNFSGFFHKVSESKLDFQLTQIKEIFETQNIKEIKYLPGGSKTIVTKKSGKKIYFDNTKPISDQIKKYFLLKQNYEDFDKVKSIDIGSINNTIITKNNLHSKKIKGIN